MRIGMGWWLLLVSLGGGVCVQAQDETEAQRTFALAYGAYKDGLDSLAETQFKAFLEKFPAHARACEASFLLGEVLSRSERESEALAALEKVYAQLPDCAMAIDARIRGAELLAKSGDQRKAVELLSKVLEAAPEDLACDAGLRACELLIGLEDWTELDKLAQATEIPCPENVQIPFYRALASAGLGQREQAIEQATEAIHRAEQPSDKRRALLLRGESLYRQGSLEAAIADLETAVDFEPSKNGDFLLALARIQKGPPQAAVEAFHRFALRHPDHARVPDVRQLLYEGLTAQPEGRAILRTELSALRPGTLDEARSLGLAAALRKQGWQEEAITVLAGCPQTACQLDLGAVWLETQHPDKALQLAETLKGLDKQQEDQRRLLLSAALVQLARTDEAAAIYGDIAETGSRPETSQRALLLLAQLYARNERWPEAIGALQSLLIRGPADDLDRPARLLLAEAFLRSGQLARGATVLEELAPKLEGDLQGDVLRRLAHAYMDQGDHRHAVPALEGLVQRQQPGTPEWGRTVLELGQAYLRTGQAERGRSLLQNAAAQLPPSSAQEREILLGIAALHAGEGSYNLAAEQYARLLPDAKTSEERSELALRLAEAYYRTERFTEAIAALRQIDLQGPHRLAALLELGLCYERLGRIEDAASSFEQLFSSGTDRTEAARHLMRLAQRAAEEGQTSLARSLLQKLLNSGATALLAEARFELAGLELKDGRRDEGLALLRQNVLEPETDARWACLSLLRAAAELESVQKWDEAEGHYQELLARYPNDQMAPYAKSRLRQVQTQAGRPTTSEKRPEDRPPMTGTAQVRELSFEESSSGRTP